MRVITAIVVLLLVRVATAAPPPFEKSPAPPRVFEGIRAGMALAEAKAALGGFAWDASYTDAAARKRLVRSAGDGVKFYVLVTGETIARIGIEAPERGLEARLTKLWGAPVHTKNPANETLTSWSRDPWRVDLACRGALCRIAFQARLSPAFFGSVVAPPGALAAASPGMSRAQLAKLSPIHSSGLDVPAGFEDVHVKAHFGRDGSLRGFVMVGLPLDAREHVTKAWGTPVTSERGPMWIGDRGWRAYYDAELRAIELVPHVTAAQLLGAGPGIAALSRPVLGAHRDQIAAAYPTFAIDQRGASLALPPIATSTKPTLVTLALDRTQRVTALAIALPYANPTERMALLKLLASKWGQPTAKGTHLHGSSQVLSFPTGKIRIEAKDLTGALEVSISI